VYLFRVGILPLSAVFLQYNGHEHRTDDV